ncbi:MAG TPA: DUF1656 domain-containing protein [Magnetospirillum sp.]|jgi:hypothetical protein|nr:DUF1656 domain-containing protein [Magnetospirillum sp.]
MFKEIDLTGVYVAPIILYLLLATPLFLACRWGLARLGVLSFVWHPALFEIALFALILALVVSLR